MISREDLDAMSIVYESTTGLIRRRGVVVGWLGRNGYFYLDIQRRKYLVHRLAWLYVTGQWPLSQLDHIDGDRANNVLSNLRLASLTANSGNRGANKNNRSGFKGVFRANGGRGRWTAQISIDGKHTHLGCWDTPEEAARAYDVAATKHFGAYAKTNQMMGAVA